MAGQNSENSHGTPEISKRKRDNDEGSEDEGRLEAEIKRRKTESPGTIASATLPPDRTSRKNCSTNVAAVVSPTQVIAEQPVTLQQAEGTPRQNTHMDEDDFQGFYFLDQWVDFGSSD